MIKIARICVLVLVLVGILLVQANEIKHDSDNYDGYYDNIDPNATDDDMKTQLNELMLDGKRELSYDDVWEVRCDTI
jgi:hypothetical protein